MSTNNVTWKWVGSTVAGILLIGGLTWMTQMSAEIGEVKADYTKKVGELDSKTAVIDERTKSIKESIKELKEQQEKQSQKLDEILRRIR